MTRADRGRILSLLIIVGAVAALVFFLFATEDGRRWTDKEHVRAFLSAFPATAPVLFVLVYVAVSFTMLPMWWAQGLAGYCFGPVKAVLFCQVGNALSAYAMVALSEWLTAGVSMRKVEPLLDRLRHFQRRLGSTGIPIAMATRLVHVIPFGPANVAFGLMNLRPRDVAIGTLLGNVGSVGFYALLGNASADFADAWQSLWKQMLGLLALNLALLTLIVVHYLRNRPPVEASPRDGTADRSA